MPNENPEVQVQVMEDEQILVAAAYFVAYNSVVGNGKILTTRGIVDELGKYDNYDDSRLYCLIRDHEQYIDNLVQQVYNATITP